MPDPAADVIQVLVVDDSHLMVRFLCELLESQPGIRVIGAAQSGLQAIEQVETLLPDLVLLDLQMPGMNGLAVLQHLRERFPGIKVVIITSHSDPAVREACLAHGAHGFLAKLGLPQFLPAEIQRLFQT